MSEQSNNHPQQTLEECIHAHLEAYFADLHGVEPSAMYAMTMQAVEKPLLQLVLAKAAGNQSRAAAWLGLNRNTLRKKLAEHHLL